MPIAVMAVIDGRIAKFMEFKTTKQAEAHVAKFAKRFPGAFVVNEPAENLLDYRVNRKALTLDRRAVEPVAPTLDEQISVLADRITALEKRK